MPVSGAAKARDGTLAIMAGGRSTLKGADPQDHGRAHFPRHRSAPAMP
jgi:hypothetical protein